MDAFRDGADVAVVASRCGLPFQRLIERILCCPLLMVRTKITIQFLKQMEQYQLYDVESINKNGDTALHLAVKNDKYTQEECIAVLNILMDWGLNCNTKNREHRTILFLAIMQRMKDVADFLLSRKCDLGDLPVEDLLADEYEKFEKQCNKVSDSQLVKFENDSAHFFEWLMTKIIKLTCPNHYKPLEKATSLGLLHILPVILKYSNCTKCRDNSSSRMVYSFFHDSFLRKRMKHSRNWYSPYANRHSLTIGKMFLDQGIFPKSTDESRNGIIFIAIENEANIDIIEMLIDRSININLKNFQGESAFYVAIWRWIWSEEPKTDYFLRILRALISKDADVNATNKSKMSPLCFAVKNKSLKAVKFLQQNGADFNIIEEHGKNLLHLLTITRVEADTDSSEQLFNLLISKGCQVGAKDVSGNTPLHDAAYHGNLIIAQKLIKYGVEVDCEANDGITPLHKAVIVGNIDLVKLLLDSGANFYKTTEFGETLMHLLVLVNHENDWDACCNKIPMLKYLFKLGADFNARTKSGYSVLQMGLWRGYREYLNRPAHVNIYELPCLARYMKGCPSKQVEFLLNYWIKLEVINLKCNTGVEYEDLVMKEKYKKIEIECRKEMEKLKKRFIDSNTSLYEWLHMNFNKKRGYVNNEKLQQFVQSLEIEKEFPEYSIIILANYRETATRKSLLNLAKVVWLELTEIRLPEVCLEIIFSFMSNAELFYFTI